LEQFAEDHRDFVTITAKIPDEDDAYWVGEGNGARCGETTPGENQPGQGFLNCRSLLGTPDAATDLRELAIAKARRGSLQVEPRRRAPDGRAYSEANRRYIHDLIGCCFPVPVSYTIRASNQWVVTGGEVGFQHRILAGGDDLYSSCVRDCSPLRAHASGRVFEASCRGDQCADGESDIIGAATERDVACVVQDPRTELKVAGEGGACVFANLTQRFVIYRGLEPSKRDMRFSWDVVGGFNPLTVDLTLRVGSPFLVPQAIVYSPQADQIAVTDGASQGLLIISPSTLRADQYF
jgi:hypothetical protein